MKDLEAILSGACLTIQAMGRLDDPTRILLSKLALTVASEEFYRIESSAPGTVSPESLLLLQQFAALCDDEPDLTRMFGAAGVLQPSSSDSNETVVEAEYGPADTQASPANAAGEA